MDGSAFGLAISKLGEENQVPPGTFLLVLAGLVGCGCAVAHDPDEMLKDMKEIIDDAFESAADTLENLPTEH